MSENAGALTLAELAEIGACQLIGDDGAVKPLKVAAIADAGEQEIVFAERESDDLATTQALAAIVRDESWPCGARNPLIARDPGLAFARIANAMLERQAPQQRPPAEIDATAQVDPGAHIGAGARIGAGVRLAAGVVVGEGAAIGDGSVLDPNVVVYPDCRIGQRCRVLANTTIGSDGFGNRWDGERWIPFPQMGVVRVGDDVSIGANCAIDRGALGDTVIGDGVKLDNQIHIAHNCIIGDHTAIAGCVGIAGSTTIGKRCLIGGSVQISGHLQIGNDVVVLGATVVTHSIKDASVYSGVLPGRAVKEWRRAAGRFYRLDDMHKRLKNLEKKIVNTREQS